jgi:hypothetical protein
MRTMAVAVVEQSEWVVAHEALSRLAKERAAADAEEGRWLLAALRSAAHVHLGFGSFSEYAERLLGYKPRSTQERLRVAEALEQLPAMARALEEGTLHWSAVRELTRIAVADNEQAWIDVARGKSVRQLEELVAGKRPGDDPSSPHQPGARRHVLRFEVAPETFALFREALSALRRSLDSTLDEDGALLAMARCVLDGPGLGGPREPGRSSYQTVLSVCAECGRGQQLANGELVPVGAEIVAMAQCDGQHIGRVPPRSSSAGSPLGGALANDNDHVDPCVHSEPVEANAQTDGHPDTPAPQDAHVSASAPPAARSRATQTPPPALRRAVLLRDQRRCCVPGCRNSRFLDVHHIQLRSEGGPNESENLLTLCGVHHRATHRGELLIERSSAGVRFGHADGRAYGESVEPKAIEVYTKTFGALRGLGFREPEVRAALAKLRGERDLRDATTEQWLRAALAYLTRPFARS